MNWYKLASFIDSIQVATFTGNSISLVINGKRYNYVDMPVSGNVYDAQITRLKQMRNRMEAGTKAYNIIKNLDKYREQEKVVSPAAEEQVAV